LAIEEAVKHNARTFVYIERVLNNWHDLGYRTAEGVKAYQRDFQKGRNVLVQENKAVPNARAYKLFEGEEE
jgi:DNA replication protein DnaD